jgi:hypothetical protein
MSDESGDQTEAELERTRRVVAATVADQAKGNQAAAEAGVTPPAEVAVEVPKGNAGRAEWAAYATARGYEIDDEWGRDDIRDLFAEEN